jgi:hypothetical protein
MHKISLVIISTLVLLGCAEQKEPLGPPFNIGVGVLSARVYQTAIPDFRKTTTPASAATP